MQLQLVAVNYYDHKSYLLRMNPTSRNRKPVINSTRFRIEFSASIRKKNLNRIYLAD